MAGRKPKERIEHANLTCNGCLTEKPTSEFHKCKGRISGYQTYCKKCQNEKTAEYRLRTKCAYWKHKANDPYYVYQIINPVGEIYVGYTSTTPALRWNRHKALYKYGTNVPPLLRASFDKHGIDNHTFVVLDQYATRNEAMQHETQFIVRYKEVGKSLNQTLSIFRIGQYSKETGELIREWESVDEAAKHFNKHKNYIYGTLIRSHRRGTALGYLWKVLPFSNGFLYDPRKK